MTLKIGWIGCGRHASSMLLPQLVRHDVRLVAMCDVDADRLATAGRMHGVRELTTDAAALIGRRDIDAVGMAVGPEAHAVVATAALARGLPVFVEKPPAATAAAALAVMAASERARLPVVVGFMKRYSIGYRIAGNVVASGRFGRVLGLTGHYMTAPTYFAGATDYTGFFLHHCVHWMDLPAFLVSPISRISGRRLESAPGRLLIHAQLDFACGALGSIAMGTIQSRGAPVERLELMGDHQRLEVENVAQVRWSRDPPFKIDDPEASLDPAADTLVWQPNLTAAANEDPKGYHALLGEAVKALAGAPSSAPTIADGVVALERLEELRRALDL